MPDFREATVNRGTVRDFLQILFRRKWIAVATVGVTVLVILYLVLTAETTYQSYSKLLVNRGNPASAFTSQVYYLSWEEELTSELETVKSARIYSRAQEILKERYEAVGKGEPPEIDPDRIDANTPGKTSIIHILYRGREPDIVQDVVRAMTHAYREFRTQSTIDPTGFLQQELQGLEAEISEWERKRADFLGEGGTAQLPDERQSLLQTKREIELNLAGIRSEAAARRARLNWTHSLIEAGDDDLGGEKFYPFGEPDMRGEPILLTLRKMILTTKSEYFQAKAQYTDSHPTVLAARDRLDDLRVALRNEANAYAGFLEAMVDAAQAQENSLEASLSYVHQQLGQFPDREAQLAGLDRTIKSLRTTYEALVQRRIDALSTRLGSNRWDVVVLEDAVTPYALRTRDYVRLTVIPLFSLLVGVALAFLRDGLDHSLKDREEAEAYLKVPVLATVDRFKR